MSAKEKANRGKLWPFQIARLENRGQIWWQVLGPAPTLPSRLYATYEEAEGRAGFLSWLYWDDVALAQLEKGKEKGNELAE